MIELQLPSFAVSILLKFFYPGSFPNSLILEMSTAAPADPQLLASLTVSQDYLRSVDGKVLSRICETYIQFQN